jgi:hypothetical protein
MAKRLQIEFANFICKFGSDKSLLDYVEDIIIPAFNSSTVRRYGSTSFFFHQIQLVDLSNDDTPVMCIAGRFVKQTLLSREQIYDAKAGLIKDTQSIESAPSALFALILNNHKLLYIHETAHAPDLNSFRSTAHQLILNAHKSFINKKYDELNSKDDDEPRVTKKALLEEVPHPSVEIIHLSSESTLEQFVKQYKTLTSVEATLVETNDELDMDGLFKDFRTSMYDIGSKKTSIKHHNKDGLSKDSAITQLNAAASQGNTFINLDGKDSNGDTLKGNNERFKITVPISDISKDVSEAAVSMYESFSELITNGIIKISETSEKVSDVICRIKNNMTRR